MIDYSKYLSRRARAIPPSGIRKFFDLVSEMKDAISLGVGEPDFVTPWSVRDAAIKSIQQGRTQYTSNSGLPALRQAISDYLSQRFGLDYCAKDEIVVTVGASEAIDVALRALIDEGDEVLIPQPSYVSYAPCVSLAGGRAVAVPCSAEHDFKLTPKALSGALTPKSKVLILPYPNNPTGAVMEEEYLKELEPLIEKHDLIVVSDEIYAELTYGGRHVSVASVGALRSRTVLINGFSKAFAMTGWRIGYIAAPAALCSVMLKIHQYVIMCAPTAGQHAALHALSQSFTDGFASVEEMRAQYDMRRRFMVSSLNDIGLSCFEPRGAFYVFPCVQATGMDGREFAEALLRSKKVAVVPGEAFGEGGNMHVRMSYASSMKNLTTAIERIAEFVKQITG